MKRWQLWLLILAGALLAASGAWAVSSLKQAGVRRYPVPDVTLQDRSGRAVSLASLRGVPLVLKITSASCSACVNDWDRLAARQRAAAGRYRIVVVVAGSSPEAARRLVAEAPADLQVLIDPGNQLSYALELQGVPTYAFVDASGRLAALIWVSDPAADLSDAQWSTYLARIVRAG